MVELRLAKLEDYEAFKRLDEKVSNDWLFGRDDPFYPRPKDNSINKPIFCDEDLAQFSEEVNITVYKFQKYIAERRAYVVEDRGKIVSAFLLIFDYKEYYRIGYWLIDNEDKSLELRKETLRQLAFKAPKRCKGFSICSFMHGTELRRLGFKERFTTFYYLDIKDLRFAA